MEIQQIITFHTIVQTGSFSAAAEKLGYSQAAVTVQIHNLEVELNTRLFDRIGRAVSLTGEGRMFHDHAIRILNDISDAKDSLSTEELKGTLSIGTIDSLCTSLLIEPLEIFHRKYPLVTINITTDSIEGLLNMVRTNDVDFAYLADQPIKDRNMIKILERETRAVFVCSSYHELAGKKNIKLEQFLDYPMILTEKDASYRRLLEEDVQRIGMSLHPVIESKNTDMILRMIRDNQGITFLPEYLLPEDTLKKEPLQKEPLQKDPSPSRLCIPDTDYASIFYEQILYHRNKWVSREMKAFFALLV